MLASIIRFEFRYQLFSPAFIAITLIFGLLVFGGVTIDEIQVGSSAAINVNSPAAIMTNVLIFSLFGMIIPTVFLASGVLRDTSMKTAELFYTTQVRERDYLLGRFIGGFLVTALAFSVVPLAVMLGSIMPWLDPENVGPFNPADYAYAYFVFGLPNMFIAGLIMFTAANVTRSSIATYTTLVALLILYLAGSSIAQNPDVRDLVALMDPFALNTFFEITRYWTPAEQNSQLPPLEGLLLHNRLLWVGVALALFVFNLVTFRFRRSGRALFRRKAKAQGQADVAAPAPAAISLPRITPTLNAATARRQFAARVGFEVKGVVFNVAFWVLLALGVFNALGAILFSSSLYGTPNYPVTRIMIDTVTGSFAIIPIVVAAYYTAELVWRERSLRFNEVIDATPTPSWVFVLAKYVAMTLVLLGLFAASMLASIGTQLARGYTMLEIDQYLLRLFWDFGLPFALLAAFAFFLQVLFNNRWLGMMAFVGYFILTLVMDNVGLDHNLYDFAGSPGAPYSDMNGHGHFMGVTAWFMLYWGAWSVVLLVLCFLLWNRGALTPIMRRIAALPGRLTPVSGGIAGVAALVAAGSGGWIFYNTTIVNDYVSGPAAERRAAEFERLYRDRLVDLPQPKIASVSVDIDLYPSRLSYEARGEYVIENRTGEPIDRVWIDYGDEVTVNAHALDGATPAEHDETYQLYAFDLDAPMAPGETRVFTWDMGQGLTGFRNSGNGSPVVYNGSFVNNAAMPSIGVALGSFMQDPQARRRQGLEEIPRAYPLEDEDRWYTNYISHDADFVDFRTTVSTDAGQIAVAPGYLEREWEEGGRRHFEYVMDTPILNFYSWLSADYTVAEEDWNGVRLQVFHHGPHDWNVARMLEASRESLAYFSEAFSPYQYRQFRIFEFPAYSTFAQAFPNSIPYSEGIGFIADLRDPDDIDYVYYVTAHEAAHQWWAHQLMAANVQGGTMLIESFAQYSALMVMRQEYGEDAMRRFLKFELDAYLSGRSSEAREELPLYRVENQQYIHYRKGALILYALQDYLGEETISRAMARLIEEKGFQGEPYATSLDFLRILREEAGPEWDDLITDFFQRIVLYDLAATDAVARPADGGGWEVEITVEARKFAAAGDGSQTEEPLDLAIDIGVFDRDLDSALTGSDHVLFLEKRRVNETGMVFVVRVDERPEYAGVDPYNTLIDRNSNDNLVAVRIEE